MTSGRGDRGAADSTSQTCMPCRGTGRLISGLGGTPHEVVCPWCRGTGKRIAGIDAQESPSELQTETPSERQTEPT